jgi:hypothetical protein
MNRRTFIKGSLAAAISLKAFEVKAAQAPPPAISAGLSSLAFSDEFDVPPSIGYDSTPGHKWYSGQWWENVMPPSTYSVANSILTISPTATQNAHLCTQCRDGMGGQAFLGGYF